MAQKKKDPLRDPLEAYGSLDATRYKAELDLVDRYQTFVAELLRLSLAGIAVFGFLYLKVIQGGLKDITDIGIKTIIMWAQNLAAAGVIVLGLCAAFAIAFRYFATEGARYYIEALRFVPVQEGKVSASPAQLDRAQESLDKRNLRINICLWTKAGAAICLALGALLIAAAFFLLVAWVPLTTGK